ncbi:MAG TPA: hypothetical protein VET69_03190 [Terriglobales bacterium]|nr:hypothetical protein [Terriglobales bacterium]
MRFSLILLLSLAAFAQEGPKAIDRPFLIVHGIDLASVVYDGELTRNLHRQGKICSEANSFYATPTGDFKAGKFYAYNLGEVAAFSLGDYLVRRRWPNTRLLKVLTLIAPSRDAFNHFRFGSTWWGCR